VNGDKMFLDLKGDEGVSKDLFFYGKREIPVTDYMLSGKIIKSGDVVLDLGANIGYYVLLESRMVGEKGVVYAVEPVTECFKSLEKNVKLNNLKNVQLFRFGAGDKNTKAFINVGKKLNLSAMTFYRDAEFTQQEEVDMITVDEFFKDKKAPNLIRMDVEGYEYAIVKGMSKTLASPNLKLLMEIHSKIMTKDQTDGMFASFKENGFTNGIIFKYPPQTWLTKKLLIRPIISWINKKIKNDRLAHAISVSEPLPIDSIYDQLMQSYAGYNVLLWKEQK
jgi:FkbM family methyltransferase